MSKTSLAKTSQMLRPLSRKDIFYSGSVANLPEFRMSQKSLTTYRQSVISLPKLKAGSEMDGPVPMEADKGSNNFEYKTFDAKFWPPQVVALPASHRCCPA
jgi:hypothetical protein